MAELVISTKGKSKLSYNGFFYVRQQEKSGKVRWTCDKRRSHGCSGAILTDTLIGNPNPTTAHNHVRDQGRIDAMKKREEMKHLAISTVADPSAIQAGVLLQADDEVKTRVGTREACSQAMARARRKSFPANPHNLNQLAIEGGFATTGGINPVRYLLYDNGPRNPINSRVVIFSTDDNLRRLATMDRWYADENFKLVPNIFKQLYIIRVKLGDAYITVLYCYLQHKHQIAYSEMWSQIERQCRQRNLPLNIQHLVIDFKLV